MHRGAVLQIIHNLLRDAHADSFLSFFGCTADVRRRHQAFDGKQWIAGAGGSLSKTSSAAPPILPDFSASTQRRLIDQLATRAIDDAHALLHFGESVVREHAGTIPA